MKIALSLDQDIRFRKEGGGRVKIIIVIKLYLIYYIHQVRKKLFVRGGAKMRCKAQRAKNGGRGVKRAKARRAEAAGDRVHLTPDTQP